MNKTPMKSTRVHDADEAADLFDDGHEFEDDVEEEQLDLYGGGDEGFTDDGGYDDGGYDDGGMMMVGVMMAGMMMMVG